MTRLRFWVLGDWLADTVKMYTADENSEKIAI